MAATTAYQNQLLIDLFLLDEFISNFQISERGVVGVGDLPHFFDGGAHVALAEQGGAGHKSISTGAGTFGDGGVVDAAVHFEAIVQFFRAPPRIGLLDFGQTFVNKTLPTEAGIDGHHEEQVNLVEIRLDGSDGGGRVDGEADFFSERADFPQQRCDAFAEFDVDGDLIRPGLDEEFQQNFRFAAHEVHVEEKFLGVWPDGGDDFGAEGNVGDEVAVHDVEVQPVGPGAGGASGFLAKAGEIGGE